MLRVLVPLLLLSSLGAGCTDKLTFSSATVESPAFSVTPEKGDANTVFRFDAGKLGEKNEIVWDFGDGKTATGGSADHRYGFTNGMMNVSMLVTAPDGSQGIATRTIQLGTGVNAKPALSLYATRAWVEVGAPANLSANGRDGDRDPLEYLWTARATDGVEERVLPGNASRNAATFDAPGTYVVKVRAKDPKGAEAVAETTISVSREIPDPTFEARFKGTLAAGTGGAASASEALWLTPAPDTNADAARHPYTLLYPASTVIVLSWNDTSDQRAWDLDLELRDASGATVFKSESRGPTSPRFEYNFTEQPPGDYVVIVRNVAGVQVAYDLLVYASLTLTPELVAAAEGQ